MGKLMSATWVQFARTGDPNGAAGLPAWPKFDPAKRQTMFFKKDTGVVEQPFSEVWSIIQASPNANASPI
jgi:para-nitrobenzyl esterase